MANIKDIIEYFDTVLPKALSMPWDNDGIMVLPDENANVKRVLIALDCTSITIEKAKSISADLIITHHPLVFKSLSSIDYSEPYGKRVIQCIKNNIAVLSYHTRLDEADGGVDDCLAKIVEIKDTQKMEHCGKVGILEKEMSYNDFCKHIKNALGIDSVYGVCSGNSVKKVAVIGGSGKDFITDVKKSGADTFLTGEVNHSGLIEARELGLNMVCGTHYETENVVLPKIKELLLSKFPEIEIEILPFKAEYEYGI
ncbi:MAG: Nif3-like dinuclear metal center hexameric protein [Clostridiales bacterium GWF2_36_10]|nr:MAG: Nif3-like dinuclear metal center hexameric protein [Clostridiales bacterium GWF2_36_10]HAN21534.1 Nif3-like dinuclear metal center hexameric protein [Clostridiales bacterium]